MYLVPPMDDEPPAEFVAFTAAHLRGLRHEARRLMGGHPDGDSLCMEVLADVAGHWRRLSWRARLLHRDAAGNYLRHRLAVRTKRWRDEQIYEVDIRVQRPPVYLPRRTATSIALRKAAVLPGTVRDGTLAVADAGIAWVRAYRRQQWHRIGRSIAAGILLVGGLIQLMQMLSAAP